MHDSVARVLFGLLEQAYGDLVYDGLLPYEYLLSKPDGVTESDHLADKRKAQHIESEDKQAEWTAMLWKAREVAIFFILLLQYD